MSRKKRNEELNEKKKSHNLLYVFAMSVLITAGVSVLYMQYEYTIELNNRNAVVLSDIEKQKKLTEKINNQEEYYNSDEYIEKVAREQLSLVKPNEILFVDLNSWGLV